MQVRTSALAGKVSIIRGGGERYRFGSTSKHIRDGVGESLELVRLEPDFIVNDIIVSGADCALETVVRLKEEIEICGLSIIPGALQILYKDHSP